MATYTITEALVKLKLANKKIEDAQKQVTVGLGTIKGTNVAPPGFKSQEEFRNEVKKRLDSVKGLISFRDNLKKAIVSSNAKTNVSIGSVTMTVAEAIENKSSISLKKSLLNKLVNDWTNLENQAQQKNSTLEQRADQYVASVFQNNAAATEADKQTARKNYIDGNAAVILTHDSIREYTNKLKEEIENFETNVDVALSISNSNTKVEVQE